MDDHRSCGCIRQFQVVPVTPWPVLDCGAPAHDYFGQILDTDGTVLLCLHQWSLRASVAREPDTASPGNGLLLFLRVDDFDTALTRARALVARLEEEPNLNANTETTEFSLRDPDGYYVTISAFSSA